jgi:hypothetical protein
MLANGPLTRGDQDREGQIIGLERTRLQRARTSAIDPFRKSGSNVGTRGLGQSMRRREYPSLDHTLARPKNERCSIGLDRVSVGDHGRTGYCDPIRQDHQIEVLAPNGDPITANGDAVNGDPT